jgi:E2/UBC family protein A/ThiF family protein/JAB domain-containing protein similar to deubiquitination enzymes
MPYNLDALFGAVVPEASLTLSKAKAVARYAQTAEYVRLVEYRRREDGREAVLYELRIELAQRPVNPIAPVEPIATLFSPSDDTYPEVSALREDFPDVIHLNARPASEPKSLCLYLEPWDQLRLHWTAHLFVERIRAWLAKTADGTLHPEDQPLEPLVFSPQGTLVIPHDLDSEPESSLMLYTVHSFDPGETGSVWIVRRNDSGKAQPKSHVAACFVCPPQTHGIIRSAPTDLADLNRFLASIGVDVIQVARERLNSWKIQQEFNQIKAARLFIILLLPKRRAEGMDVEKIDRLAFLCDCTLEELEERLTSFVVTNNYGGLITIPESVTKHANIKLLPFSVTEELTPELAARLNGITSELRSFCLLGVGALGSQVFDTLLRSGFGRWTVVDGDRLLPHNLARHRLTRSFIGRRKDEATTNFGNDLYPTQVATPLHVDVLRLGENREILEAATAVALATLDCTASVPVARAIAAGELTTQRAVSLFMNPSADALVLLAEDQRRSCRLDWLEMQYYREIATRSELSNHLRTASTSRYSNSCRDLTAQIPQELVGVFASIGSRAFREAVGSPNAQISIWQIDSAMRVSRIDVAPERLILGSSSGWTICTDNTLLHEVYAARELRLPNETGGVLLGSYDMQRQIIYVVAMLPSPPDSDEWPTSYKRGCAGLASSVTKIADRTLLNLDYIGEWHSHPAGVTTDLSEIDKQAMAEIISEMEKTGLPGLMLIVGDNGSYAFHLGQN